MPIARITNSALRVVNYQFERMPLYQALRLSFLLLYSLISVVLF